MSLRNVGKYKFLTGGDILPEIGLLEKAVTIKRLEYSLLGSKLNKQTDIAKNSTYQGFDKVYEFDKKENGERISKKQRLKSIINQIFSTVINLVFANIIS